MILQSAHNLSENIFKQRTKNNQKIRTKSSSKTNFLKYSFQKKTAEFIVYTSTCKVRIMFDYEDPSRFMYGALKGCVFIKMLIFSPRLRVRYSAIGTPHALYTACRFIPYAAVLLLKLDLKILYNS